MARLDADLSGVNEEDLKESGGWRTLPDGDYTCEITASDFKATQVGDGMFLKLKLEVLDDGLRGRFFFDNMTLKHPNADTVRIARAQLKRLAIACRHPQPDYIGDSAELHGIPIVVTLERRKARNEKFGDADGYENRVVGYRAPGTPAPSPAPAPAQARNGRGSKNDGIPF